MPNGVKYVTNFIETVGSISTIDQTLLSSPIQTVSGGTNWNVLDNTSTLSGGAAVKNDGTLWLWGLNGVGQLGNDSTITRSSPVQTISGGTNWKQVSTSYQFAAAIKTDGTLWSWGNGLSGRLGNSTSSIRSSPVQTISGGTNWKQVSASYHVAAIKTDGTLWLWGDNGYGQLGNGNQLQQSSPLQTVAGGNNWTCVDVGGTGGSYTAKATVAIKADGTLWTWGGGHQYSGGAGVLGNNSTIPRSSPGQTIAGGNNWAFVNTSGATASGIKTDGTLWLWGKGRGGLLGNNSTVNQSSPIQTIASGNNWKASSFSTYHALAVKTDGTLWAWGYGLDGILGDNSVTDRSSPVQTVSGGNNWVKSSAVTQYGVGSSSFAVKTDGTLWAWGIGNNGQLGNNATTNRSSPVQTIAATKTWLLVSDALNFSTGSCNSAAVKSDGTLWLWGGGGYGRLGNDSTITRSSPVQTISGGTNWSSVSVHSTSAGIKTDGTLWLWGHGYSGLLGNNSYGRRSSPVQTVSGGTNWKQVGTTEDHIAAIKTDGTLWLWGNGYYGVIGNNSTINRSSPVQTVSATTNWRSISVSIGSTAAIKTDGTLWLWGCGGVGRLGNNSTINRSSPVQTVSATTNWQQVSSGLSTAAAVKSDGTLWMWGGGYFGELGNNSIVDRSSPVQTVSATTDWKQVSAANSFAAAVKTDGTLWIWGARYDKRYSSPIQTISGGTNWNSVSAVSEANNHVLATKTDGTLWGWGDNFSGQLGIDLSKEVSNLQIADLGDILLEKEYLLDVYPSLIPQVKQPALWMWGINSTGRLGNSSTIDRSSPVQTVAGGTNWKCIAIGNSYSAAATKTDGTLWLWGCDINGQLGNNSTITQSSPVQTISATTNWSQASISTIHSAAIKTDGTLWLWGVGTSGQLANNAITNRSSPTQTISATTNWLQVSLGRDSLSAAIKTDGTLWLWGIAGTGQLGNNSTINRSSPTQTVSATTNWKIVGAGGLHAAAIKTDGTLWSWGGGNQGQLGNNSSINQSSPVQTVSATTDWKQVSAGRYHTVATKTNGTLWMWGSGAAGRLGDGSTISRSSPVQTISGGTNWKFISAGTNGTSAIKTDGTLWIWGNGGNGQIGNNSSINQSSPVQTVAGGTSWKQVVFGDASSAAIEEQGDW